MDPQDRGRLGADGALVVRQPGLVGRADLAEDRRRRPRRSRGAGSCRRFRRAARARRSPRARPPGPSEASTVAPALLLTAVAASAPVSSRSKPRDPGGAPAARSVFEVELQVAIASGHLGHGRDGFFRERGAAQPGVEQDPGRVDHRPQGGPPAVRGSRATGSPGLPGSAAAVVPVRSADRASSSAARTAPSTATRPRACNDDASSSCSKTAPTGGNWRNTSRSTACSLSALSTRPNDREPEVSARSA